MSENRGVSETNGAEPGRGKGSTSLFYKDLRVLDARAHGGLRLKANIGASFAAAAAAVPLALNEFAPASRSFPICFAGETHEPLAVLGVHEGANLFVDERGGWRDEAYKPAYIRRYPFNLIETAPGSVALAIENDHTVIAEKDGWPLFNGDKPSSEALRAFEFCRRFHAALQATELWVRAIVEADLLVECQTAFEAPGGRRLKVDGFRVVDEAKLRKLDAARLLEWNSRGWLSPLFAHVHSSARWADLCALDLRRAETPTLTALRNLRS